MMGAETTRSGPVTCPAGHLLGEMVDGVVIVKDDKRIYAGRIAYIRCDCGKVWRPRSTGAQNPPA